MSDKIYIDYSTIKEDIETLSKKILNSKIKYDIILALSGGGLIPARLLRNYLEIPVLCLNIKLYNDNNEINKKPKIIQWLDNETINTLKNKNVLIVDDLDDTRSTLSYIVNFLKFGFKKFVPLKYNNLGIAVIYNKIKTKFKSIDERHEYFKVIDIVDKWIVFPWE